jgi:nicotinamidase/pyrazinamidase
MTRGLLIVDVQNDFIEGGALGVDGGKQVAKEVGYLLTERPDLYTHVYVSQDWHNPLPDLNGGHFADEPYQQPDFVNSWPVHCVGGTRGAELEPGLRRVLLAVEDEADGATIRLIQKGQGRPDYSAFQGRSLYGAQTLAWELSADGTTHLDVVGIATDHCVRASALDALNLGRARLEQVRVIGDLIAGVDPVASAKALEEIQQAGGVLTDSARL